MNTRYLRISSACPLGVSSQDTFIQQAKYFQKDDYVLVQNKFTLDLCQNLPAFKVGSCPLERKPRGTLSAKFKINLDNVCLSMRGLKLGERKENLKSGASYSSSICRQSHHHENEINTIIESNNMVNDNGSKREQKSSKKKKHKSSKSSCSKRMSKVYKNSKSKRISLQTSRKGGCAIEEITCKSNKTTINSLKLHQKSNFQNLQSSKLIQNKSLPCISRRSNSLAIKGPRSFTDFDVILSSNGSIKSSMDGSPVTRLTKVYLSEKRSGTLMGVPAVPPATPCSGFYEEIEWVPSMSDMKSKRLVTSKLAGLVSKQAKRENEERITREQKQLQEEKQRNKEMLLKIKQRQRAEIYALNKILTEVENATYEKYKEERGLPV
ncbi:uncharacterized protein LOC135688236 isoform X2 [Rhopilema esculentum]|uniref:uncharacterized protein LOC135688236 isoform X2 n=1 Tax=Rhopilema esculentum TaxID=499914 RepID=UPI0031E47DF3